jgi:Major capsid protein Gp23
MDDNTIGLNKVILPAIRRIMPNLIANQIIGVQPMSGPAGQIFTMKMRYDDPELINYLIEHMPDLYKFVQENKLEVYCNVLNLETIRENSFTKFVYISQDYFLPEITEWSNNTFGWDMSCRGLITTTPPNKIYLFREEELTEFLLFKLTWA